MNKDNVEEFSIDGTELVEKVKQLIHEGNIRRIIIKNQDKKTIIEIPLTVGVIGSVITPVLAAVSAIAVLLTSCTISIHKVG